MLHRVAVFWVIVALASGQSLETLSPSRTLRVPLNNGQKVREFVAADDGFRFLVQSGGGDFQLLSTRGDGQPKAERFIGSKMVTGLVLTSDGSATVAVKDRRQFLIRFDRAGSLVREELLDCFGVDFLLAISGNPATVCADGRIVEHQPNGRLYGRTSWIRPGSTAEILGNRTAAIIDRSTAEAVMNDLESNRLSPVPRIPEIDRLVKEAHAKYKAADIQRAPGSAPIGKPLIVMDTAQESSVWYVLIWPYNPKTGVLVAGFDVSGKPVKKFRCQVPGQKSGVHRMDVRGNTLNLVSTLGDIFQYRIN